MLREMVKSMGFLDWEKMRFHGLRKGFATTLQNNGLPLSLIAFAGMWTLQAAIFSYLKHTQADLLRIAAVYLYGNKKHLGEVDMDDSEFRIIQSMHQHPMLLKDNAFDNTQALRQQHL